MKLVVMEVYFEESEKASNKEVEEAITEALRSIQMDIGRITVLDDSELVIEGFVENTLLTSEDTHVLEDVTLEDIKKMKPPSGDR